MDEIKKILSIDLLIRTEYGDIDINLEKLTLVIYFYVLGKQLEVLSQVLAESDEDMMDNVIRIGSEIEARIKKLEDSNA